MLILVQLLLIHQLKNVLIVIHQTLFLTDNAILIAQHHLSKLIPLKDQFVLKPVLMAITNSLTKQAMFGVANANILA